MSRVFAITILCTSVASAERSALEELAKALDVPHVEVSRLKQQPALERAPELNTWSPPMKFGLLNGEADDGLSQSTGYLARDDERLYVAIRSVAPLNGLPEKAQPLDGNVWSSDNVEVMLLPALDDALPYFQFAIDPAGSLFDAKINNKSWNSGADVKVFRDAESWTAVLSVKFSELGLKPGDVPALWRVNLHSYRAKRGTQKETDLAWSPTRSRSNHVPSRFGLACLNAEAIDRAAAAAWIEKRRGLQILLKQRFDNDVAPFTKAKLAKDANGSFLVSEESSVTLEKNFGDIKGLKMAFAYRTPADVHGLTVQGSGTVVRATRPGMSEVYGHALKVAQETCNDADGQTKAWDLGRDAFKFRRPYGH
ncbi:MAG TPA: hypothetical protein VEJ63_04470 [Planctomycetota bacterium]|nr:hypothetical protein [Planctomycetota bacterium]